VLELVPIPSPCGEEPSIVKGALLQLPRSHDAMAADNITVEASYDLFLSYNSADHVLVEEIACRTREQHLKPFLDRWDLVPGVRWRPRLEEILSTCKAVAVCIGPGEMGRWQQREVDVALDLQANHPSFPVIPVLLPGCEPPLGFLRQLTWVDLRNRSFDEAIIILAKAARGEPPGPDLQRAIDSLRASICPYRGLLYFREEDAPFFFGREAGIDKLVDAVQRLSFVAVVGASGSGKSSVVRAGLVPRLRSDRRTAWEIVTLVPTDQPLRALARALMPLLEPTIDEVDRLAKANKLEEHFRTGAISLSDTLQRVFEKQPGTDRVLIVADQFEELYTLTADEEARRRFLDEILAASLRVGSKVNVVLTLRGDFVGNALAYRPLSDRLQDAQINLGPMIREEIQCAICKPAEKIQLEFEAGLVRQILNDVGDEPGNLPLLEFVLKELWEQRRGHVLLHEAYEAIGGLQGAVATKADNLFKALSCTEQKILQRIFLLIVRPSAESGLDTRRRAAFAELPSEGKDLVIKLANERLLVTNQSATGLQQTVEVAHEALISNWNTLRAWVNEDREFLLWRDRVGPLVSEWERAQESDEAVLHGSLLTEAQKWFDQRNQDLSEPEQKFISASRALRERLAREQKERQEREIEAARKLAEEQRRRAELSEEREKEQKEAARKLRRLAIAAAGTAAAAVILFALLLLMWPLVQELERRAVFQGSVGKPPPRTFQALDTSNVLVLGFDSKLWLEHAPFGKPPRAREQVDANVQTFQALDVQRVLVLGKDGNLWLEQPPFGTIPPTQRLQVDAKAQTFQALDVQHVLVLGKDGNLWLEQAPFGKGAPSRQQIDKEVQAFKAADEDNIFVLGTDGKLWVEQGPFRRVPPSRQQVEENKRAFQALDSQTVFVVGIDDILWLEHTPFRDVHPVLVDGNVRAFQALDTRNVFVLRSDENLWLEQVPSGNVPPGQQVEGNVRAFEAMDIQHVLVLGTDGKLWLEEGPFGPKVPPSRQLVEAGVQPPTTQ
jgi:TIR domain